MGVPRIRHHLRHMRHRDDLAGTIRYLRFPLEEDHRLGVQDGSACPHCSGMQVQKWGRFSGRQRFRCCQCRRTFSTFTATALHYLKRPERWTAFLWCVDGRLTIRRSAAVVGINKDTALRWRHRLLEQWRAEPRPRLKGRLAIGHFCLPGSEKGKAILHRPARRRGEAWSLPFLQTDPVTVLAAWEGPTALILRTVDPVRLANRHYQQLVAPRVRSVTEIVGAAGPAGPLSRFAKGLDVPYRMEKKGLWPSEVYQVRKTLRRWLRPFRGVASRRLDNYLEWFRRRGLPPSPTDPADRAGGWSATLPP